MKRFWQKLLRRFPRQRKPQGDGLIRFVNEDGLLTIERRNERGQLHSEKGVATRTVWFAPLKPKEISFYRDGLLHRENNLAAETIWSPDNYAASVKWAENGQLHRTDGGPALIERNCPHRKSAEAWFENGRKIGPTRFWTGEAWWWRAGSKTELTLEDANLFLDSFLRNPESQMARWISDKFVQDLNAYLERQELEEFVEDLGLGCLLEEPAISIERYERIPRKDGGWIEQFTNLANQPHRTDGPAIVFKDSDGLVIREEWWRDGQRHRDDDDPAVVSSMEGDWLQKEWWKNGEKLT